MRACVRVRVCIVRVCAVCMRAQCVSSVSTPPPPPRRTPAVNTTPRSYALEKISAHFRSGCSREVLLETVPCYINTCVLTVCLMLMAASHCQAIREEIGDDNFLMMDANQKWDVPEAIENMKKSVTTHPLSPTPFHPQTCLNVRPRRLPLACRGGACLPCKQMG